MFHAIQDNGEKVSLTCHPVIDDEGVAFHWRILDRHGFAWGSDKTPIRAAGDAYVQGIEKGEVNGPLLEAAEKAFAILDCPETGELLAAAWLGWADRNCCAAAVLELRRAGFGVDAERIIHALPPSPIPV